MSLINEALKRTRDAAYQPTNVPPVIPSYRYDPAAAPAGNSSKTIVLACVAGILVIGAGIAWYGVGFVKSRATLVTPPPITPVHVERKPELPPKIVEEPVVETLVPREPAPVAAPVVSALPPEPPKLSLQGISGNSQSREALINNQTLVAGEEILGAKIVAVERDRVVLEFAGGEIVLRLR